MKRTSPLLFVISLILLVFVGISIILFRSFAVNIENDASTLNGLGMIRGSIQRFSKLELSQVENRTIEATINNLMYLYSNRNVPSIEVLNNKWQELKQIAEEFRKNPNAYNRKLLLDKSEECWTAADQMVLENQYIAEHKVSFLTLPILLLTLDVIVVLILLFIVKKYVYDTLEVSAIYDPLTKIFNRRYFMQYLTNEIQRSNRNNTVFSLVMFDIDYFKRVNDTFGHHTGDEVLKAISAIAKETLRKSDVLSRIGGEEFTILLPDTKVDQALVITERVRKSIEAHLFPEVKTVTVSLGITEFHADDTPDSILQRADTALYKAKNAGRNRIQTA